MKTRFLISGYFIILFSSLLARFVLISDFTDSATGFFTSGKPVFLSLITLLLVLLFSSLIIYVKRCPVKMPKITFPLSFASFLVAVSMFANAFSLIKKINSVPNKTFNFLSVIALIVTALFFLAYSAKFFKKFHIRRILYTIPLIYWLFVLVKKYISISRMALIPENAIIILATVCIILFMLSFTKFANKTNHGKNDHKWLMFYALISSVLCEYFAIPQLYFMMNGMQKVVHNDLFSIVTYLTTGLFIQVFSVTFFSNKNLLKKRRSIEGSEKILPTEFQPTQIQKEND